MYSIQTTMSILSARIVILFVLCTVPTLVHSTESRLVQTVQGPVRGYKDAVEDVFVFYGIPYATAPTGPNKFKAPGAPAVRNTTLEAVNNTIVCPIYAPPGFFNNIHIQEDCLIANVYTPKTNATNLPVVVYIHGGAFISLYGSYIEPKKLVARKNIIAVSFNYRVGAHGFLCLGTEDVPGNAGLKDQVALLRWVKDNIGNFGGNSSNIAISGFSAGASSVDLLMISPVSQNLFNKVIAESGGGLAPFTMHSKPLEYAKEFARQFNVSNVDDICALENFYKTASYATLTTITNPIRRDMSYAFQPCVERVATNTSFLTVTPYSLLLSGNYTKVPVLYGFSKMEGSLRLGQFDTYKVGMNQNFTNYLPATLTFQDSTVSDHVSSLVKQFYFGNDTVNNNTILSYLDYYSDVAVIYPTMKVINLLVNSGHTDVHVYEYTFYDNRTALVPHTNVSLNAHGDQVTAIFDSADETNITQEYKNIKGILRDMWGDFITTGAPVASGSSLPAWPTASNSGQPIMILGRTVQLNTTSTLQPRMSFWEWIFSLHYLHPAPPNTNVSSCAN